MNNISSKMVRFAAVAATAAAAWVFWGHLRAQPSSGLFITGELVATELAQGEPVLMTLLMKNTTRSLTV
jgi:hypothetical protein